MIYKGDSGGKASLVTDVQIGEENYLQGLLFPWNYIDVPVSGNTALPRRELLSWRAISRKATTFLHFPSKFSHVLRLCWSVNYNLF